MGRVSPRLHNSMSDLLMLGKLVSNHDPEEFMSPNNRDSHAMLFRNHMIPAIPFNAEQVLLSASRVFFFQESKG
eukprot:2680925-Pyramimonas_sp.AAC.2